MKYLHLFPNDKFTEPYISFINKAYNMDEHLFLIIGKGTDTKLTKRRNVLFISKNLKSLYLLLMSIYKSEKVFLHGLFSRQVVILLFLQPWILKKSNWVVWGGDLYEYKKKRKDLESILYEFFRKSIIKRMYGIITLAKGDYDLAKKWYGVNGKYFHGIYINPIKSEYLDSIMKENHKENKGINIQIGNSADPSNKHLEVLRLLEKFKNESVNIFVPLSYGDQKYAMKVVEFGKKIFGEKFNPLLDFLPPEEYSRYLSSIDVAIFSNERQQGLGNIFGLIYLGKKVFIRNDISTWDYLKEQLELKVSNYLEIDTLTFSEFSDFKDKQYNNEKVKKVFDEVYIKNVWDKIFEMH